MDRLAILQRHDAKVLPDLRDVDPISNPAVRLGFSAYRYAQRAFAPLALDVRTLAQYLFLKIPVVFIVRARSSLLRVVALCTAQGNVTNRILSGRLRWIKAESGSRPSRSGTGPP